MFQAKKAAPTMFALLAVAFLFRALTPTQVEDPNLMGPTAYSADHARIVAAAPSEPVATF
jgi:hypothetical protein